MIKPQLILCAEPWDLEQFRQDYGDILREYQVQAFTLTKQLDLSAILRDSLDADEVQQLVLFLGNFELEDLEAHLNLCLNHHVPVVLVQTLVENEDFFGHHGLQSILSLEGLSPRQLKINLNHILKKFRPGSLDDQGYMIQRFFAPMLAHEEFGLVITDDRAKIIFCSPGYAAKVGLTPIEVRGKSLLNLGTGVYDSKESDAWEHVKQGEIWRGHLEEQRQNGEVFMTFSVFFPLMDTVRGQPVLKNMVAFVRDVSQERNLDNDQEFVKDQVHRSQRLKAIGTLAGGIAHDFNNILTPIYGFASMALDSLEGHESYEDIQEILKAAERAKSLVHQLLTFSRSQDLDKSRMQMHILVKETMKFLQSSLPTGAKMTYDVDPGCPDLVADVVQLRQVLLNLFANSADALPDENGLIEVSLKWFVPDPVFRRKFPRLGGKVVHLTFRDNGCGIAPENMERLFDPFFTTKRGNDGSGMGLPVVHGVVSSHNGNIEIQSQPGEGTLIDIYLPCAEEEKGVKVLDKNWKKTGGNERIAIIDDDVTVTALCRKILQKLGYLVVVFNDSQEFVDTFENKSLDFDLILTDYMMPDVNGLELTDFVHQKKQGIPVVLMSGFGDEFTEDILQKFKIWELIHKPIIPAKFANSIRKNLDNARVGK